MMNILIADDMETKRSAVYRFLKNYFPKVSTSITTSTNRYETFKMLEKTTYELVVLDMAMPDFSDSVEVNMRAGKDIIEDICFNDAMCSIIAVTQYYEFIDRVINHCCDEANGNTILFKNENYKKNVNSDVYETYIIKTLFDLHNFLSLRYCNYIGAICYSPLSDEWEYAPMSTG